MPPTSLVPPRVCVRSAPQPQQPLTVADNGASASAAVAAHNAFHGVRRSASGRAACVALPRRSLRGHGLGLESVSARAGARLGCAVAATAGDSSEFEENEKLRAELKAALELAERLQLERDEAQLDTFESNLRGMSGTGSESAAGGDVTRRGAPPPVEDKSLLLQWPEPSPVALQAAWSQLCDRLGSSGAAAAAPAQGSFEVRRMHPPMRDTLLAAMDAGKCQLRFWTGVIAADSVPSNEMKSDFMFTHLRDRLSSLLGAAVLVEVKSPGDMQNAITQAGNYARRRMREVFAAARLRGDVALHELAVWAVATDGREVVIMRVMSGAPKPGGSYKDAVPCPSSISPPLPLLGEWDFAAASGALSHTPPAGFAALARVLCADADALLGATTAPLTSVLGVQSRCPPRTRL
jgi:hypothetical protein